MFKRIILIVMDSVGIGHAPDAAKFNNEGANTIGHIESTLGPIHCPTLRRLGLGHIADITKQDDMINGIFGRLAEKSLGKDTTSGHWELMGLPVNVPFPTYYDGFPADLMEAFTRETGYGYLGNEVASGTEIIDRLGPEHIRTGKPIVYTSADSVFQIAAHEEVIPLNELYRICDITRNKVCINEHYVGRVIARPFLGTEGNFTRTSNRHDYSRLPDGTLNLEILKAAGYQTIGIGKIGDIYAQVGITDSYPTKSNSHGMNMLAHLMNESFKSGLCMVNLVEFDSLYGHRRDVNGYKREIEFFDYQLGGLLPLLDEDDLLLLTADHGNDPTWEGSDHTRELVPLLGYYKGLTRPIHIGDRSSFADVGQTILENFHCPLSAHGESFLKLLR